MTDEIKRPIKEWNEEDKPREKLLSKGIVSLTNAELIAILIGSGSRNESAVDLSRRILKSVGNNLNQLGRLTLSELLLFKGIGDAKAVSVLSAMELGRRRNTEKSAVVKKISSSQQVFNVFSPLLSDLNHEQFWILLLNRANHIIGKYPISVGGTTGTVVDVKIILKIAIENLACAIVLVHNHPSGNLTPSEEDLTVTEKMKEACRYVDISLLDHVIVGQNEYNSLKDSNLM